MNDEIKARLVRYADQLESAASKGADFLAEQAPETVRQFLAWHFWSAVALSVLLAVVAILLAWASRRAWTEAMRDDCEGVYGASVFFAFTAAVSVALLVVNVFAALKIAIAPNVFIIEKLAEMAK